MERTGARDLHNERFSTNARDSSDLVRQIAELKDENARLRREFLGNGDRFWDWDVASGCVRITLACATGDGLAPGQSISSLIAWEASLHPEDRTRVVRELCDYVERKALCYQSEHRIRREDSGWKWVRDRGSAIWDEAGRAVRMQGAETDITSHKLAEADLAGRESRLRSIFASLAEGVVLQDLDGRIVHCNAGAERILGRTREQLLGLTSFDPIWQVMREDGSPVPADQHPASLTLRSGEPQSGVVLGIQRADGARTWVSVNCQPLRAAVGAPAEGVIVSFSDITPMRRMTERLLEVQKLESVARLAGGIAHDFNNLLTAVLGYAELGMSQTQPQTRLANYLTQIIHSGDRAASLTRQLLAFGRRQSTRPEHIDLAELLRASLAILRPWVGLDINVELDCGNGLWPVQADRGQLQQLLLNLASNAADAMEGGGALRLSVKNVILGVNSELSPGEYVELRVIDNGVGMPADVLAHVFEPFFTTKDVGEGSGLGLATCYGIVRQHRGSISVQSTPGAGATFTIRLPRAVDVPMPD